MAGTLVQTTNGLILAEPCDNTPAADGWTQYLTGTKNSTVAVSSEAAHSGSNAWDFQLANDWAAAAQLSLYKTVNIPAGGHPLIRCFRGLSNVKGAVYDDFLGSSLNQFGSRWSGGGGAVSGSIYTAGTPTAYTPIGSTAQIRPNQGNSGKIRIAARLAWFGTAGSVYEFGIEYPSGDRMGFHTNGSQLIIFTRSASGVLTTISADSNYHVFEVEWDDVSPTNPPNAQSFFYVDGVDIGAANGFYFFTAPNDSDGYAVWFKGFNGTAYGPYTVDWLAVSFPAAYMCSLTLGSQSLFNNDAVTDYGGALPVSNNFFDECNGWAAVTVTGNQTITLKVANTSSYLMHFPAHIFWDDLMIMYDKTIVITGLLGGQKIELYNSGGTLLYSWTCPSTGTNGTLVSDITGNITSAYGLLGYFKVYDTNGTTLLYTSPTLGRWGGDVYNWLPNTPSLNVAAVPTQIFQAGSGYTPTTTAITATLLDAGTQAPLSGRTITFATNLGTCNPASAVTDANGHATSTFTAGSTPGLGGVQANFAGDATYGSASVQQFIDVYQTQPSIDPTKGFQVFVEGQEIVTASGNYLLSTAFQPQSFQIVTPEMGYSIGGWWLIQIYRFGVLEFSGRILGRKRQSGTNPQTTITGVDNKILLQRRVVNSGYTDDPKNIINSLLNTYPCGVSPGTIASYGNTLTLAASYEVLADALAQIQTATGWLFRLNAAGTLDFGSVFGALQNVIVTLGVNGIMTDNEEDWSQLNTSVTAVGSGTGSSLLVAQVNDPVSTLIYGLIETVSLQKSVNTQGALNLVAAQLLATLDQTKITITVDYIDQYQTGTYGPFDTITVNDTTTGLSGLYKVFTMKRDLTNPNYAELTLTHLPVALADILQALRSNVKDLSL